MHHDTTVHNGVAPSTATSPSALRRAFHEQQTAAWHHFTHPDEILPDEAAVGHSPDLSSADLDDETEEERSQREASHPADARFGVVSPFALPWGADVVPSRPLTPLPLPRVRLFDDDLVDYRRGREGARTSLLPEVMVIEKESEKRCAPPCAAAAAAEAFETERSQTQKPTADHGSDEASILQLRSSHAASTATLTEEANPPFRSFHQSNSRELTDEDDDGGTLPHQHATADVGTTRALFPSTAASHASLTDTPVEESASKPMTAESASVLGRGNTHIVASAAGSHIAATAMPPLPSWSCVSSTGSPPPCASSLPAITHAASQQADAAGGALPATPPPPALAVTPLPQGQEGGSAAKKASMPPTQGMTSWSHLSETTSNCQARPALVVWKANASQATAASGSPTPSAQSAPPSSMPSHWLNNKVGDGSLTPASSNGGARRLTRHAAHHAKQRGDYGSWRRKWSLLDAPYSLADHAESRRAEVSQGVERSRARERQVRSGDDSSDTRSNSSSNYSDSEDEFEDHDGSSDLIFTLCVYVWSFVCWLVRRCRGVWCVRLCCRRHRRSERSASLTGAPTDAVSADVFSETDGNDAGVEEDDDDNMNDEEEREESAASQVRRPLLAAFDHRVPRSRRSSRRDRGGRSTATSDKTESRCGRSSPSGSDTLPPPPPTTLARGIGQGSTESPKLVSAAANDERCAAPRGETNSTDKEFTTQAVEQSSLLAQPSQQRSGGGDAGIPRSSDAAEVVRAARHRPRASFFQRCAHRLSRYSPAKVMAYLNVFAASAEDASTAAIAVSTESITVRSGSVALPSTDVAASDVRHSSTADRGGVASASAPARRGRSRSPASVAASEFHRSRADDAVAIPAIGQIFVLLHYIAFFLLTVIVVVLAVFEFRRDLVAEVRDDTACNRFAYADRFRPDFSFSLICFVLNGVLATHYAVRAVRLEKGGLLVVQAVTVLLQGCRAAYFLCFVAERYLRDFNTTVGPPELSARSAEAIRGGDREDSGEAPPVFPLLLVTHVLLLTSVSLFLLASLLIPWVYRSFGWRRYAQGIVSVTLARVRQRLTSLQTCVQLDNVITLNAYLATVFLLDTWYSQGQLLGVCGVVWVLHAVLVPALRRTRHWWSLVVAVCVLLAVSGYFAALIGRSVYSDLRLRTMSSSPWYSACYTDQLPNCLLYTSEHYPVVIYRDWWAVNNDYGSQAVQRTTAEILGVSGPSSSQGSLAVLQPPASPAHATELFSPVLLVSPSLKHPSSAAKIFDSSVAIRERTTQTRSEEDLQKVDNKTDTFLPTRGSFRDYFRVEGCNADCFAAEEEATHHAIVRGVARCCGYYGQCRLKDAFRTYAVVLLALLAVCSYVVRMVLLGVAWRRVVGRDDAVIDVFLKEKRRQRRGGDRRGREGRVRRGVTPEGTWTRPSEDGRGQQARQGRVERAAPQWRGGRSSSLPLSQRPGNAAASPPPPLDAPLIWNVQQYNAWRHVERDEGQDAELLLYGTLQQPQQLMPGADANPLSRF